MTKQLQRKSLLSIVLVVIVIGMTTLGMRLPVLSELASAKGKPKPRPRAVLQKQVPTQQKEVVKSTPTLAATITTYFFEPIVQLNESFHCPDHSCTSLDETLPPLSRGSPGLFPKIC